MTVLQLVRNLIGGAPQELNDGDAVTVDARFAAFLTIITDSNATVTVSRVDSESASSHAASHRQETLSSGQRKRIDVDWSFYRISVSGGTAHYDFA